MHRYRKSYGWIPDFPDQRDLLYKAIRPVLKLPTHVDLRVQCSAIEDQGRLGSCTAQALAGNLEFLDNRDDQTYTDVSRLFIYYNERRLMNTVDQDSGATLRDGIKTLAQSGVCAEDSWPYDIPKFTLKPTARCFKEALRRKIQSYHRLDNLNDMLLCLADGYPFVFGIAIYESFETAAVAKSGIVPMPKKDERLLGGHAVLAVGFDQKTKRLIVRNSWGNGWGMKGYFTLPYLYAQDLARDFWTIRK